MQKLKKRALKYFRSADYQPQSKSEISRALDISPKERADLRAVLRDLEADGTLVTVRKGRYALNEKAPDEVAGIIEFNSKGFAFVTPDDAKTRRHGETAPDVFVPGRDTGTALPGDRVLLKVKKAAPAKFLKDTLGRRQEGRVVKVLERRNNSVIGTFHRRGKFAYVQPDNSMLPPTIDLVGADAVPHPMPPDGDTVVVAIDDWDSRHRHPQGRITKILGAPHTPGVDILSIIYKHQLPLEFPPEVIAETKRLNTASLSKADLEGREDFRGKPVFTIDPVDAKDFDDAVMVTPMKHGGWELAVHIADVSHYVSPGTELDKEARRRGNSVYLVDRVIPMLPPELSNGICSLRPEEDRLTRFAVIRYDSKGIVKSTRFGAGVINSFRRLTYEQAMELIARPDKNDAVSEHLANAWALASVLRKRRFKNGSLDLDFPEVKVFLDENGTPIEMRRIPYDESHQLVEEFMLAANDAVAKSIKDSGKPGIYRIHEDPDADKLFEFRENVLSHGFQIGDPSNPAELQKLLQAVRGAPEEQAIKIALLKSLKRAAYSPDPIGHYGLAKVNYTHFTSPIRRYADLVVHRVLNKIVNRNSKEKLPLLGEMKDIAAHLSVTERTAADAEIESRRLKELEYFSILVAKAGPQPEFDAVINEVRRMGLFVELSTYLIRGLIRPVDFPEQRTGKYFYDHAYCRFVGRDPKVMYAVGDKLKVTVAKVDLEEKFIDFRVVAGTSRPAKGGKKKAETRRKGARKQAGRGGGARKKNERRAGGGRKMAQKASGKKSATRQRQAPAKKSAPESRAPESSDKPRRSRSRRRRPKQR